MTRFSPSDVAFEGFRLTREQPRAVLVWSVLSFFVSLAVMGMLIASGAGRAMMEAEAGGADPVTTLNALSQGGASYFAMIAFALIVQSIFVTAVFRAILRPQDSAFGYLRLGMDEVRQLVLFLVLVMIIMVSVFLIVLIGGVAAVLARSVLGSLGSGGLVLGGLASAAIGLWVAGLVVFVIIRLSLSPPMTFAEQRLRIMPAWKLSHGSFWRLFGAYALAFIMFVVVWLLAMVVVAGVVGVVGVLTGEGMAMVGAMFNPDMTSMQSYLTVPTLINTVFTAGLSAVNYAVIFAPSAVAYQLLSNAAASVVES